jgi:hypothetical protein
VDEEHSDIIYDGHRLELACGKDAEGTGYTYSRQKKTPGEGW